MKHLFLFTIGPVQSFIAQARKTQDLYAGSQILSSLIKTAIDKVKENNRNDIMFPNTEGGAYPNRFIASIELEPQYLKQLGEGVEETVKGQFRKIANDSLKNADAVKYFNEKPKLKKAFEQQINQHLEIFWVFETITTEGGYAKAFENIEKKLGAIKNVRQFSQFTYNGIDSIGEKGRKCSLDGERNALFFGNDTNENYLKVKWNPHAIVLRNSNEIKLAKNEGLSAVSFAKRFYDTNGFPSTAKIALMESLSKIDEKTIKDFECVFGKKNLLCLLEKERCIEMNGEDWQPWDDQFYYEENLIEKNIPCKAQLEIAKTRLKDVQIAFKNQKVKFDKYYAILTFDGDNMGKWLSGEKTPHIDLKEFHIELAKCLSTFAKNAKIDNLKSEGRDVYAGGDDFLGFVNLHHLFDVLKRLRKDFDKYVNVPLKDKFSFNENLTFSAGVAIAHYKTPLNIVLNEATNMQKNAKNNSINKNALGIAVLKHSGESHQFTIEWGKNLMNIENLEALFLALKDDFSDKWIYNFAQEFALFVNKEEPIIKAEYREMMKTEIVRLMARACKHSGNLKKEKVKKLQEIVEPLLSSVDYCFKDFIELLNIANFMASKTNKR